MPDNLSDERRPKRTLQKKTPQKKTPKVLACQNVTCQQQGAEAVLKVLQQQAPAEVTVEASGCLGQCGNGPVILVQPENIWHLRVSPKEAKRIATEQLGSDRLFKRSPLTGNHSSQKFIWIGAIAVGLFLLLCIGAALTLGAKYR